MDQPTITQYTVSDFAEWELSKQLQLTPRFQRRSVWPDRARSYFVDTVLRGLPCPPLFIRASIDPTTFRSVREVVDGQQRLRTVLGYIRGEFPVSKVHNPEFGGLLYAELPESAQKNFLGYRFAVELLENVTDAEVLGLFARFNTNTVKLNAQELRNARFFGAMKQLVYELALGHYQFWLRFKVLNDTQIARMQDAELVSELLLTMLDGLRSTRSTDLDAFYSRFEDELPPRSDVEHQFQHVIDMVGTVFEDDRVWKAFRRRAPFFSLFIGLHDLRFGTPGGRGPVSPWRSGAQQAVATSLHLFATDLASEKPSANAREFILAGRTSTSDPARRRLRHGILLDVLSPALG